jgi:transcriptional regulator with XRE-family HTH domain
MGKLRKGEAHFLWMLASVSKAKGGEELRIRRVIMGLTQAEVAWAAGMAQSRLSNYEKGRHKKGGHEPNAASRERILKAIEGLSLPATVRRLSRQLGPKYTRSGHVMDDER